MKVWHALEIEIARVAESAVTAQLWSANTTGLEISEDTPEAITLRAYFEAAPDIKKLQANIQRALRLSDLPEAALRSMQALTIADQDWLAEWKKGYEPIAIGEKLLITPSWKRDQIAAGARAVVQIDPGMAFGTGTHETTRGCLELLEKYWYGGSLLDVGTGTGILAIAAVKLAPGAHVIGFDIDPEAIDVALENAEINGVADSISFEVNKLASFHGQAFDVVLANLTADVIVPLAADFPLVIKAIGTLIVSGILREQGDDVRAALGAQGFQVIEAKPDGEWVTFAMKLQN
ncbi:MAG TPA: 50S ribosomal protein L11 methyltransferase [Blastocatellia bacterium]|nr:50S ribosomal protein L11 methyltransferase [Blastocatellia bacterium]